MTTRKPRKIPKIVVVIWRDASSSLGDPRNAADLHEASEVVVHTVGFLVRRDRKGLYLTTDWDSGDGAMRGIHFIPNGMIQSVRDVPPT